MPTSKNPRSVKSTLFVKETAPLSGSGFIFIIYTRFFIEHPMAKHFTEENFEQEVLKSSVPVFVDFWAEWCPPCKAFGPIVEEFSNEVDASKLIVGKLDVDAAQKIAMEYRVLSIPTSIVFKNGEVVEKFVGSMTKEALAEKLSAYTK